MVHAEFKILSGAKVMMLSKGGIVIHVPPANLRIRQIDDNF